MKQYLLLRDNTVLGPYQFEMLIDIGLTDQDLIWVENKSKAWVRAVEVKELQAFVQEIDEDIILQRREERIRSKKVQLSNSITLTKSEEIAVGLPKTNNSFYSRESNPSFQYKAPYFKERVQTENVKKEIWQKPEYQATSLLNVTLVLLVVSFCAFIVRQLVEKL